MKSILTDPSLSPSNLTSALDSLPDTEWIEFGRWMDVPQSRLDKIESQFHTDRKRKQKSLECVQLNILSRHGSRCQMPSTICGMESITVF